MGLDLRRPCPCASGVAYGACCAPYHRREREAEAPEALMRSRYAAFALGATGYLWDTLHAHHEDRARPRALVQAELARAAREMKYTGLEVLEARPADSEGVARVLFLARVFERGKDRSFVEVSDFQRDAAGWRYLCGLAVPLAIVAGDPRALSIDAFKSLSWSSAPRG